MACPVLPLGFLQPGRDAVIKGVGGGRNLCQRMADLGLVRGARVRVIRNDSVGPLIISVGEARLAIGRGMAVKIAVEQTQR